MQGYIYLLAAVAFLAVLFVIRIRQLHRLHSTDTGRAPVMLGPKAVRLSSVRPSPVVMEARAARKSHREMRHRLVVGPIVRAGNRLLQARDASHKRRRAACSAAPTASSRPMSAA
jgi:hypothetical protein